jgi:GNAT superfamily N-acetyltransferase
MNNETEEVEETEYFVEKREDCGQISYKLYANVCRALLVGRGHLMNIDSDPKGAGFGTKMLEYVEKKAVENGLPEVTVSAIADEEKVRHFFEKNGYKLTPDPQCAGESEGKKLLRQ